MSLGKDNIMERDVEESNRVEWSSQTTKLLIEEVRDHLSVLHHKNYMQKKIWKQICSNFNKRGYNITEEQCSTKWKNLKQKYKSILDNNNASGRAKESWEYFDIIDSFLNTRPEIAPVSIASSTHGFRITQSRIATENENNDVQCNDENDPAQCNIIHNVTRNIRKRQSGAIWMRKLYKQRKHYYNKNIEMQQKFLSLFEKYIEQINSQED